MNTFAETTHRVRSVAGTHRLAAWLAAQHPAGGVIALHGALGSGKTVFVQGLALALNIREPLSSPTFTLVQDYPGNPLRLVHMDLYRIRSITELENLDFETYLEAPDTLVAIEWAGNAKDALPPGATHVYLQAGRHASERRIRICR